MIAVLVMTDGRDDYLWQCLASTRFLKGDITEWWVHDDTGDEHYRALLMDNLPGFQSLHEGRRRGFGGAIRHAWSKLAEHTKASYVLHLEQDFLLRREVHLDAMVRVLDDNPHLIQLALRRQPWNDEERAAGGIVEQHPDAYADRDGWMEHSLFFTTNPSLYRRSLLDVGWPDVPRSEGEFTHYLLRQDPATRFGFWGSRNSGEWVEHIGHVRAGRGY